MHRLPEAAPRRTPDRCRCPKNGSRNRLLGSRRATSTGLGMPRKVIRATGMGNEVGPAAAEASSQGWDGAATLCLQGTAHGPCSGPCWGPCTPALATGAALHSLGEAWLEPGPGDPGHPGLPLPGAPLAGARDSRGPHQAAVCTHPGRRQEPAGAGSLGGSPDPPGGGHSPTCLPLLRFPHPKHQARCRPSETPGFPASLCYFMGTSGLAATPRPSPGPCSFSSKTATSPCAVQTHPAPRRNRNNHPEGHSPGSPHGREPAPQGVRERRPSAAGPLRRVCRDSPFTEKGQNTVPLPLPPTPWQVPVLPRLTCRQPGPRLPRPLLTARWTLGLRGHPQLLSEAQVLVLVPPTAPGAPSHPGRRPPRPRPCLCSTRAPARPFLSPAARGRGFPRSRCPLNTWHL